MPHPSRAACAGLARRAEPGVALFFAFLRSSAERGGVFVSVAVLGLVLAAMAAGAWRERLTGSVLVALGVRLAFVQR